MAESANSNRPYSDAPPEEPRSTTSYLILAVNVALLALAVFWVIHKSKSGPKSGDRNPDGSIQQGTRSPVGPDGLNGGGVRDPRNLDETELFGGGAGGIPGEKDGWREKLGETMRRQELLVNGEKSEAVSRYLTNAGRKPFRELPPMSAEDRAKMRKVADAFAAMGPGLEVTRSMSGSYPTSKGSATDANRGIEALAAYYDARGRLKDLGFETGDTDGDGRAELLDAWGRPLIYFTADDYESPQQVSRVKFDEKSSDGSTIYAHMRWGWQDGSGRDNTGPNVYRQYNDDGAWQAEKRFQLWSAGPNGADDGGSYDDVASWHLK